MRPAACAAFGQCRVGQRAHAPHHQVGDSIEVDFPNRIQIAFVADVIPEHPAWILESAGENHVDSLRAEARRDAYQTDDDLGENAHVILRET